MAAQHLINGRQALAAILNVTTEGLLVMERRGLPVYKHGGGSSKSPNIYDTKAVVAWLVEDKLRQSMEGRGKSHSRAQIAERRAEADARKAEIEVAKLEGAVLDAALIRRGLDGVFVTFRTMLMTLAPLIGREIDDTALRVRITALVERRMREALDVLCNYDPASPDGGAGDDRDSDEFAAGEGSAETHRQPVGRAKPVSQPRRRGRDPLAERDRAVPR